MKKTIISSTLLFIAIITFGLFSISAITHAATITQNCANPITVASWEGCEPIVTTNAWNPDTNTSVNEANVSAFFSSNGADYNHEDNPSLSIEYGPINGEFDHSTIAAYQNKGTQTVPFLLEGLYDHQAYKFRAVLNWVGGTKYGDTKTLPAERKIVSVAATDTSVAGTTTTDNSITIPAPTAPTTGIFSWFTGGTKKTTTTTSPFQNTQDVSGFKLAIDDGVTKVNQGDDVTIKVRYENNNSKTYNNGTVKVYLAPQYIFNASNKGIYDRVDNTVAIDLRDFPGGGFGTVIIDAKATGKPGDLDQAISQATMKVGGASLKVSDVDEYGAGSSSSNSILGGSVTGSGFLPGGIIGWVILLIILALVVIVGRRYFKKSDY